MSWYQWATMLLVVIAAMGAMSSTVHAETRTFTDESNSDHDWNNAANWKNKIKPASTDDVVILPGKTPVLAGSAISVQSVRLSSGAHLSLQEGARLTVGPASSSFYGGVTIRGGATLILNGTTTWGAGSWRVGGRGATDTRSGGTIENHGSLSIIGNTTLSNPGDGRLLNYPGAAISSSASATINAALDNDGTLIVKAGTLTLAGGTGGDGSAGQFVIQDGAELSSLFVDQRLSQGARVTGAGTLRLTSHTFEMIGDGGDCLPDTTLVSGGRLDLGGGSCRTGRLTSDGRGGGIRNGTLVVGDGASHLESIMFDGVDVIFNSRATITSTGSVTVRGGATLVLTGTTWSAGNWQVGGFGADGTMSGGTIINQGSLSISGNTALSNPGDGRLLNSGHDAKIISSGTARINAPLYNLGGLVDVQGGTLATTEVEMTAGAITVADSATLGESTATPLVLTGGTLTVTGTVRGLVTIVSGELHGAGTIRGVLENLAGKVVPGPGPATLHIEGDFIQASEGTLELELSGLAAGTQSDLLEIRGTARLDGEARVQIMPSFQPVVGEGVEVLRYAERQNMFARVPGLDLPVGRLRASYEEPGSLWLRVATEEALLFASNETGGAYVATCPGMTGDMIAATGCFRFLIGQDGTGQNRTISVRYLPVIQASQEYSVVVTALTDAPAVGFPSGLFINGVFTFTPNATSTNRPNGTTAIPAVGYRIDVQNSASNIVATETITQDLLDRLRQEYVDATMRSGTAFTSGGVGLTDNAPPRSEVITASSRAIGGYGVQPNCSDGPAPNYHVPMSSTNSIGIIWDQGFSHLVQDVQRNMNPVTVCVHSGHRSPSHNRRVGGVLNSDHQWGRAADMAPQRNAANQTTLMLQLYRATLGATTGQVLLERNTTQLLPARWNPPPATHVFTGTSGATVWSVTVVDINNDGLPDSVGQIVATNAIPVGTILVWNGNGAMNPAFRISDTNNDGSISMGEPLQLNYNGLHTLDAIFTDASHVHGEANP